jgi:hypothetical protein
VRPPSALSFARVHPFAFSCSFTPVVLMVCREKDVARRLLQDYLGFIDIERLSEGQHHHSEYYIPLLIFFFFFFFFFCYQSTGIILYESGNPDKGRVVFDLLHLPVNTVCITLYLTHFLPLSFPCTRRVQSDGMDITTSKITVERISRDTILMNGTAAAFFSVCFESSGSIVYSPKRRIEYIYAVTKGE